MSFILSLDQGTTSSRAIVFEHGGAIRASAQKEFQQIFPQPGWVEHNPREIWSSQLEVARTALARAGIKAGDLAAIGIAHLIRDGFLSRGGHIWLAFAVAGFIQQFGPWGLLDRWWPVFLVWGGLIFTLRAIFPQPRQSRKDKAEPPSPGAGKSCDPGIDPTQVKP